jgi:hypothetical protein
MDIIAAAANDEADDDDDDDDAAAAADDDDDEVAAAAAAAADTLKYRWACTLNGVACPEPEWLNDDIPYTTVGCDNCDRWFHCECVDVDPRNVTSIDFLCHHCRI